MHTHTHTHTHRPYMYVKRKSNKIYHTYAHEETESTAQGSILSKVLYSLTCLEKQK